MVSWRRGEHRRKARKATPIKIYVDCPNTGDPAYTGFSVTTAEFEEADYGRPGKPIFYCERCKKIHRWTKSDAYLVDER